MNKEGLNVLSLFNGMGCAWLALDRAGIKVNKRYSSEIDKYATIVNDANYPDTIQLGSVINVNGPDLPKIDLLVGGSPCQSFSFAGKRKGMATKCETEILNLDQYLELKNDGFEFEGQSYLFWEYMRILTELREVNPDVLFLLENVEMGEKWEKILSKAIGVNGIHINSALVSAQNRKRIYWSNIGLEPGGLFGYPVSTIKQPKDKGILLKDILEPEVNEKYYLSEKMVSSLKSHQVFNKFKPVSSESLTKASCITARLHKMGNSDNYIKIDKKGNIKNNQDKASCFTAGGHSGGNHSDMDLIVHNTMPRSSKTGKGGTGPLSRNDGKTYCLDTGSTNAVEIVGAIRFGRTDEAKKTRKENLKKGKDYTPFSDKEIIGLNFDKMNTVTSATSKDNLLMNTTSRIRRLTPLEAERLQTVPDFYTNHVSDSQRYKMLGNGWTIEVIAHIFKYINK